MSRQEEVTLTHPMDPPRILIVDDDAGLRKTLADILRIEGYLPRTVATGGEALSAVEEEVPDVAVIDLMLADMSGIELMEEIKARSPDTECVILTAYASLESAIQAVQLGAYGYAKKPYDAGQLLLTLRRAVEKRRADQALRRAMRRWYTTFDALRDAICLMDLEHRVQLCNRAMADLVGRPVREIPGHICYELLGDSAPHEMCPLRRMKKTHQRETQTLEIGGRWYEVTVDPVLDEAGELIGAVHTMSDITERRRMKEERKQLQEQLLQAQKLEAIGRLAGGVAHDFNNLLTAINGYSQLLLGSLSSEDPRRRFAEVILEAGQRAAALTRQLLLFSRRQVSQPRILNLNEAIANLEKMLRRLIGEDVHLLTRLDPELCPVRADPAQIDQVLMNLSVNARDAMPQGGTLIIRTSNVSFPQDAPGARPGQFVRLSVEDTGMGMDEEVMAHIFEPFFTTKEDGTGLGLSVVYGIVQDHSGWIEVESEPGKGTAFAIYLPAASEGTEAGEEAQGTAEAPQGHGEGVLVVEDEPRVRAFATWLLNQNGYTTFEATTVREAQEVFTREEGRIHLLFTDMVLPDGPGLGLVDRLLARQEGLGILLSSGYLDDRSQFVAAQERGFHLVQKPYTASTLLQAVHEALGSSESAS